MASLLAPHSSAQEISKWKTEHVSLSRLVAQVEKALAKSNETASETTKAMEESTSLNLDRIQYAKKVNRKLVGIKSSVERLHRVVERLTSGLQTGGDEEEVAEALQRNMETLQSNIAEFRDSMRSDYEHTVAEERALAREITTMNERFIAWETAPLDEDDNERVKVIARKPPRVSIVASTVNGAERYQRKLQAIQDKIDREGGLTGGWHPQEHKFFLAIWNPLVGASSAAPPAVDSPAFRRLSALVRERAVSGIPSRNGAEVEAHMAWFVAHCRRLTLKKELVEEWRRMKREQEARELKQVEQSASGEGNREASGEAEEEDRLLERQRQEEEEACKRAAVAEWRERKAEADASAEAAKQSEAEAEEADALLRRQQRRGKQEAVALYKLEKEQRAQHEEKLKAMLTQQGREERQREASGAFALRDRRAAGLEAAKAKRGQVLAARAAVETRARVFQVAKQRSAEVSKQGVRKPSRVTQDTNSSAKKTLSHSELDQMDGHRAGRGAHSAPMALGAYDLKHATGAKRAVPAWRQRPV